MSYQERRTIVSLITGFLILGAYCIYAFGRFQAGADPNDLRYWAGVMLTFIGIGIVATIVIQIIFHILMSVGIAVSKTIQNERVDGDEIENSLKAELVEDEMGKLIELKSLRVTLTVAGIGFVAALLSLVLGYSAAAMLNILFISFLGGSLLEGIAQLYFFRRGVSNA